MKSLIHFGFLMPLLLFVVHQLLQRGLGLGLAFFDAYLDPFCLGAMVPYLVRLEHEYLYDKSSISGFELLLILIMLSTISEGLFPLLSSRFTSDWWDVLAIATGIVWFVIMQRKKFILLQNS